MPTAPEAQDPHKDPQAIAGLESQNPWSGAGSNRRPSAFQFVRGFLVVAFARPRTCGEIVDLVVAPGRELPGLGSTRRTS